MKLLRHTLLGLLAATAVALLSAACETDNYEKGEGTYSKMRADLGELTVNADKQAVSFVTDDGDQLQITPPRTAQWIETADTVYRALLYYNKVSATEAEPMFWDAVITLSPIEHWRATMTKTDPMGVESTWVSRGGKYLNVGLLVRSAYVDDKEGLHLIGLVQDTILTNDDHTRTQYLHLVHDQNDVPLYYTNRHYISLLLPHRQVADSVCLRIQTFDGTFSRTYATE